MNPIPYTLTNESITVIVEGKPHVVKKGATNYAALRAAILNEDWDSVPKNLTAAKSIMEYAKNFPDFQLTETSVRYQGKEVDNDFRQRIHQMVQRGEDPTPMLKFWERLQKNPSWRSVHQLFSFLKHQGIPITKDGHFLAYKGVRADYKDVHSGTFDNRPGNICEMPRNQISDDPNHACHEGFHVGAIEYAKGFGPKVVICRVDPADVVCVPFDSSQHKMRVCKYRVIGLWSGENMPDTMIAPEDVPVMEDEEISAANDTVESEATVLNEKEEEYDPDSDLLAEECDECGNKVPVGGPNKWHADSCSLYDGNIVHPDEEKETTKPEGVPVEDPSKPTFEEWNKAQEAEEEAPKKLTHLDGLNKHTGKKWVEWNKKDAAQLLEESIGNLRQYAGHGLKIVGASKIPGGKLALVNKIVEVRNDPKLLDKKEK
jgi:hypothetical protein